MSHDRMPSHTQTSLAFLCSMLFLIGAVACSGDENSPPFALSRLHWDSRR